MKLSRYEDGQKKQHWQKNFKFSNRNPYVSNDIDLDLLTDKGVYPYDYFTSFDKFREKQLPPKEASYSNLTESHIEDDEYERAQKIWKHVGIRNLGQYHDLYLRTDVLLLTDLFENFRDLCLEYCGLDPAHYFTLPDFAWDAMLLKNGVTLWPTKRCMKWLRRDFRVECVKWLIRRQRQTICIWKTYMMKQNHLTTSTIYCRC